MQAPERTYDKHAYPADLAALVLATIASVREPIVESPLLAPALLESVLSTIFQASLLREEGREVSFRAILCPPDTIPEDAGPPSSLHAIRFEEFRRFRVDEIRRLANAAPFQRALLGVCVDAQGEPGIWGIVHSGARWLRALLGGREAAPLLPRTLLVTAAGAGRIEVALGETPLARLDGGRLGATTFDVFRSEWLSQSFAAVRAEVIAHHGTTLGAAGEAGVWLDDGLVSGIARHMLRQVIAVIRASRHGGTILVVPPDRTPELFAPNDLLYITHRLVDGPARRRFRALLLAVMTAVARVTQHADGTLPGWPDYRLSGDSDVAVLDEAMFELSHLIAGLAAVDGAVVLTQRFEILGFGAEIAGRRADVPEVARAGDVEGTERTFESVERVGTRHRSAYRFCAAVHDALAVVISQDGDVRFVRWHRDAVTYWPYLAGGLLA